MRSSDPFTTKMRKITKTLKREGRSLLLKVPQPEYTLWSGYKMLSKLLKFKNSWRFIRRILKKSLSFGSIKLIPFTKSFKWLKRPAKIAGISIIGQNKSTNSSYSFSIKSRLNLKRKSFRAFFKIKNIWTLFSVLPRWFSTTHTEHKSFPSLITANISAYQSSEGLFLSTP